MADHDDIEPIGEPHSDRLRFDDDDKSNAPDTATDSSENPKPAEKHKNQRGVSPICLWIFPFLIIILTVIIICMSIIYLNPQYVKEAEHVNLVDICTPFSFTSTLCRFSTHVNGTSCNTTCSCLDRSGTEWCKNVPGFTFMTLSVIIFIILDVILIVIYVRFFYKYYFSKNTKTYMQIIELV